MNAPAGRRPVLLIANPVSGGKIGGVEPIADDPSELRPDSLTRALEERGLQVRLHPLRESDDVAGLVGGAVRDGWDVVVAGGDGTVGLAAAAMVGTDATLGILALGSFNNIARGMGVPMRLEPALGVIAGGSVASVDVGLAGHDGAEEETFLEAAGVGLEAATFGAFELAERGTRWRALRLLWRALRQRRRPMWVTVDGSRRMSTAATVVVCNTPYHGPGVNLVPEADPADGQFHVAVLEGMSNRQTLVHYLRVLIGRRRRAPAVRVLTGREVRVEAVRGTLPAHADGRSIGLTPVRFSIRPRALRIFRGAGGEGSASGD